MPATVEPKFLTLAPGASETVTVRVQAPKHLPAGAQETQVLLATPQNGKPESMEFITLRRVPFPFLVHDAKGWEEVQSKVGKYEWAKKEQTKIVAEADKFVVPEVSKGDAAKSTDPLKTPALFNTYIEQKMFPAAVAWKLTGDKKYAEKVAEFLRRFASPKDGYPTTLHAVKGDIPQEGGSILAFARAYDMIQDAGVLSAEDKANIEEAFRIFVRLQVDGLAGSGGISNWSVFNICPAAQCALLLHDMASFNTLMYETNGVVDHLRYGTMDDGWWYEMSIGYNLGCAEEMTSLGLAARPFGIDFLEAKFPASLTQKVGLRRFEFTNFGGMAFGKFGPVKTPWVSVKKMWDGILSYPDYRSVIFGIGDSHDTKVSGGRFETAYYAYRDPAYVPIIKQGGERDLIFGVPELPEVDTAPYSTTARSDNAGVAVLRSQTKGREPREQIQAVLKYGTHGSYHGHFDRLALNALMRYGRSFWNPETSWYGYGHFMYKMWVQPSVSHNMVVVDGKMQEPTGSEALVFHAGDLMQVIGVENTAHWSNPPFLGGYDEQAAKIATGDVSYMPTPTDAPTKGEVTGFTGPVRGRRLMIVTDDYVVLADDFRGEEEHQFDNMFQLRGARLENADKAKSLGRDPQLDTNPLSSGQFITDVHRYAITAPAVVRSETKFPGTDASGKEWKGENWNTGGYNDQSEPGILKVDEYVLWPKEAELLIGRYAESWWPTHKKLEYAVQGDGKTLASGVFGPWILGSGTVDVDVKGLGKLQLSTAVSSRRDNKGNLPPSQGTIFWGDARLVTADGKEVPLSQLKTVETNVLPNPGAAQGKDYSGGPIVIAGIPHENAVAAEPIDTKQPAVITLDLAGLNATRFKASVGGDWAIGNEDQLRKTVSVRTRGKSAQFLTLLEPYEEKSAIKSAIATGPDALRVELTDGRVQEIKISGLDADRKDVGVQITETKDGKVIRSETTALPSPPPVSVNAARGNLFAGPSQATLSRRP